MTASRPGDIERVLQAHGVSSARELKAALGISQPTLSRRIAAVGSAILRIGRGRASRYALARDVARAGNRWPLYRIDAQGQAQTLGELCALHGDGYHLDAARPLPALLHGDFATGLFPGLPWFLDDVRPQGFLGRLYARRVAAAIGAPEDLARWQPDDVLLALLRDGADRPGDLLIGEAALQTALQSALVAPDITLAARVQHYPRLARAALLGEPVGSSAAGEQPKFTASLRDADGRSRHVIVKFSERIDTPAGRRWADLLRAERLAGEILHAHDVPAATAELIETDARVYLESQRFDRSARGGRHGVVSLAALDAAFHAFGRVDWWRYADTLLRDRWLDADDAARLRLLGWFGALIGNTDMHLGNASLLLADAPPLHLAPAYDMLPMLYRPAAGGEVVTRDFVPPLPTPNQTETWRVAAAMASDYWQRLAALADLSDDFRQIADTNVRTLQQAVAHLHPHQE